MIDLRMSDFDLGILVLFIEIVFASKLALGGTEHIHRDWEQLIPRHSEQNTRQMVKSHI